MNIKKIAQVFLATALLSSCEFNEDFCIRDGILYATCDYSRIQTGVNVDPTIQHLIGYGRSNQTQPVSPTADFVTDTLEWKAPQGNYDFLLYSGSHGYSIQNQENMAKCAAHAKLRTENEKTYYAEELPLISYNIFSETLVYQQPVTKEADMKPLTQQIIIRLHLKGNELDVLDSIYSELDGMSIGRSFQNRVTTQESASVMTKYEKKDSDKKLWEGTSHVMGISDGEDNIFRLYTKTSNNSDDAYELDLSPYLKGIEQYKIIINLDFIVGKELEINVPVIVENWGTGEQVEIEIKPVQPKG